MGNWWPKPAVAVDLSKKHTEGSRATLTGPTIFNQDQTNRWINTKDVNIDLGQSGLKMDTRLGNLTIATIVGLGVALTIILILVFAYKRMNKMSLAATRASNATSFSLSGLAQRTFAPLLPTHAPAPALAPPPPAQVRNN